MKIPRRKFMKTAAGALGLFTLGGCTTGSIIESIVSGDNAKEPNYRITRYENDKPPIAWSHCFRGDINTMHNQEDYSNGKEHTNLIWEYPWHGTSPNYLNRPATVDTLTDILHYLIKKEELGKTIVGGWSLGGIISINYAIKYPEDCAGLVVIGSAHDGRGVWQHYIDERILKQKENPEQAKLSNNLSTLGLAIDINQTYLPAEQIEVPSLVIVGDQDEFFKFSVFKELRDKLNERGAGCRFCVTEGADHLIQNLNVNQSIEENYDYLFGNE